MENMIYKISLKSSINRGGEGDEKNLNRLLKKNKISLLELL